MERAFARIEIVDKTEGDTCIESAVFYSYISGGYVMPQEDRQQPVTAGGAVSFIRDNNVEEGKGVFYLYVPEMVFDKEVESGTREISLLMTDGSEHKVYLAPYDDGKVSEDPVRLQEWDKLRRNHLYRLSITGNLKSEIELQDTLRVCWYRTNYGKFENNNIYGFFFLFNELDTKHVLNYGKDKGEKLPKVFNTEGGELLDSYYWEFNIQKGVDLDELCYVQSYSDILNHIYEDEVRSLSMDIKYMENKDNITYCWLNTIPVKYLDDSQEYYSSEIPCRIYIWGVSGKSYNIDSLIPWSYDSGSIICDGDKTKYDSDRLMSYVDFKVEGKVRSVKLQLRGKQYIIGLGDVCLEKINGIDYYVFYTNCDKFS